MNKSINRSPSGGCFHYAYVTIVGMSESKAQSKEFYSRIGKKGGSWKGRKGFALNIELAAEAGKKGGKKSKRGPAT